MSEKSGISMYIRLQIAFLFQFAIWGSWNVVLGGYPGIQGVGLAYSAFALGALFAPLIGSIVDTRLAAQKMLCILHFIGGAALIACGLICVNVGIGNTLPKWPVLILIFLHGLAYMPSLPLINAVVFKHIPNKDRAPLVFVFGTIGWALVNLFVKSTSPNFFFIGGGCCIFLALYSLLILPDTPPEKVADKKFDALEAFGLRAFSLFRYWKFAVFMICVTMVGLFGSNFFFPNLSPYLNQVCNVPMADTARWGILNQVSELVFMTALAFCVGKFGLKWVLTLGLGAWGLRYFLLTLCSTQTAVMALLLHGIAYAFLYTAAYMYGDKVAPSNMKASVQGLIALLLLGVGQVTSGIISDDMHKNIDAKAAPAAAVSFFESTLYAQEEAAPADDADLVLPEATEQAAPAEAAAPVEEVVSVEETAPAEEVVSVEEAAPAEEVVSVGEAAPAEEVVSVEEVAPVEEAVLVEEFVSDDDVTPAENTTVQEGGYSVEHWKEFFQFPAIFCFVWMLIFAVLGSEPVELGVAAKKDDASKAA